MLSSFANVFELCQHERGVTVIGRLSQCSHVGRPREIKKFALHNLRSVTQVRVSLLSTVEAVATLVIKHRLRKLFCCNIHRLTLFTGLLSRWWWVEMKVQPLPINSDVELWPWEHFIQEYLTQIGGSWEFSLQPWFFIITIRIDNPEIEKWLKSRRIWKITTQEGNYPQWQYNVFLSFLLGFPYKSFYFCRPCSHWAWGACG